MEFYDWGRKNPYNLQRFSALPYQAKPICDFNNPKIAWNAITALVKMMIEKDLDPGKIEIIGRDLEEIYERQVKGNAIVILDLMAIAGVWQSKRSILANPAPELHFRR